METAVHGSAVKLDVPGDQGRSRAVYTPIALPALAKNEPERRRLDNSASARA